MGSGDDTMMYNSAKCQTLSLQLHIGSAKISPTSQGMHEFPYTISFGMKAPFL